MLNQSWIFTDLEFNDIFSLKITSLVYKLHLASEDSVPQKERVL